MAPEFNCGWVAGAPNGTARQQQTKTRDGRASACLRPPLALAPTVAALLVGFFFFCCCHPLCPAFLSQVKLESSSRWPAGFRLLLRTNAHPSVKYKKNIDRWQPPAASLFVPPPPRGPGRARTTRETLRPLSSHRPPAPAERQLVCFGGTSRSASPVRSQPNLHSPPH